MVKVPTLYKKICKKLRENAICGYVDCKKFRQISSSYGVSKDISYKIIREMEGYGLIKRINKQKIKVKSK